VSRLGIERQAKDVTPSLAQYLASLKAEATEGAAENTDAEEAED